MVAACCGLVAAASPAAAHRLAAFSSWGDAAVHGGRLVEVDVQAGSSVRVLQDLCRPGLAAERDRQLVRWQLDGAPPRPGSSLVGILHEGAPSELHVPDPGWTRWALDLVPAYRLAVCEILGGSEPGPQLRAVWPALLAHPDPRARDEASRIAGAWPQWVTNLTEAEALGILGALAGAPVPPEETLRWVSFLLRMPTGDVLLAVLRTAESSGRPVFRQFVDAFRALRGSDPAVIAWCRELPAASRPQSCPGLPPPR